ncbi:MAG: hypothetical protein ACRCXT_11405, partial [Paraclostridium sp.]
MTKDQVIELRQYHEAYGMSVYRTEGIVHHEDNDRAHLIWDDNQELVHSIDVNTYNDNGKKGAIIHSFNYESITGIYSKRNVIDLEAFLDKQIGLGIISLADKELIMDDYDPKRK